MSSWGARLCLLASAFFACQSGGGSHVRTYPAPSAEDLVRAVRARQAAVRGINVETRATSWLGGERVRGTVQMLVERSGQLRFEAEVALQGTVALLAVSGDAFTFIDHRNHVFRSGPACPANVAALIRIPMRPAEVAAILLGDLPMPEGSKILGVEWDAARAADVLVVLLPQGTTLWLGLGRPNPNLPAWDVVYLEGTNQGARDRWRVSYEELERAGAVSLPRLVRFAEPSKSFDDGVEIKVRERSLNPTFAEGAFSLHQPSGYSAEVATCSGQAQF